MISSAYQTRLASLNGGHDDGTVLDSIDRPIRGLILAMNARGIHTKFSCCGFYYDREEEPKTHSNDGAFVVFYGPKTAYEYEAFHVFAAHAFQCGWVLSPYFCGPNHTEWITRYQMSKAATDFYERREGMPAIHDYELPLIAIKKLEHYIKSLPELKTFTIVDGNKGYAEILDDEWQISPKRDYVFEMRE